MSHIGLTDQLFHFSRLFSVFSSLRIMRIHPCLFHLPQAELHTVQDACTLLDNLHPRTHSVAGALLAYSSARIPGQSIAACCALLYALAVCLVRSDLRHALPLAQLLSARHRAEKQAQATTHTAIFALFSVRSTSPQLQNLLVDMASAFAHGDKRNALL